MPENLQYSIITIAAASLQKDSETPASTVRLEVSEPTQLYKMEGSATLSSSLTLQENGTPNKGTTFIVEYKGSVTLNGNTLTLFGYSVPNEMSTKNFTLNATWDGSAWVTYVQRDAQETSNIPSDSFEVSPYAGLQGIAAVAGTPASTTETELFSYTLPAGTLTKKGDSFEVHVAGETAANANAKTVRLKLGGTTYVTNSVTGSPNNLDWMLYLKGHYITATVASLEGYVVFNGVAHEIQITKAVALTWASSLAISFTGQNGTASANDIVMTSAQVTKSITQ